MGFVNGYGFPDATHFAQLRVTVLVGPYPSGPGFMAGRAALISTDDDGCGFQLFISLQLASLNPSQDPTGRRLYHWYGARSALTEPSKVALMFQSTDIKVKCV